MDTQTQIDRLIELAIIQRSELKQLVEQLPQLREHLNAEVEKVFDETEPQLRAELEEWTTKQTADKTAALGVALEAKIADLAKSLEVSTQARYNAIIAEREENARLAAQAEAKIAEHAASLPSAVKEIVSAELARFPRAGEIDQLRKEFAEPRGLNPRGKWQAGETYNKLDLITINGDSYTSNTDGNRTRPSRSSADWTLVAARGTGGGGGPTSLSELTTVPSDGDLLIGSGTSWVTSNLTAGAGISITVGPGAITISATDGDITLDDGTAASPSLHFTNDADTGIYRPAANTLGISTSGVQRMYVDQNGITTVGAGGTFDGSVHAANGNANNPSFSFSGDQDTGFFRHQPNEIGVSLGGTQKATLTSTTFTITPNLVVSGTGSINGTTIPASKTLVVTTDKLSALASTSSSELAGVISDETGTGALVFANTPTLVTPNIGAATGTSLTVTGNVTASDAILGSSGPSVKSTLSARAPRQGLVFDGTAGADVASVPAFGTGDFTFAAWVNQPTLAAAYLCSASAAPDSAFLYLVGNGTFQWWSNTAARATSSAGAFVANKWTLLTATRTGGTTTLYANGVPVGSGTDSQNLTAAINRIGQRDGGTNILNGALIPLIYNRALSASEVVALYEAGAPAGADYNSASNTSINTSAWANYSNPTYAYQSFTSASATGFTASNSTNPASGLSVAVMAPQVTTFRSGTRYLVTFSATLTSGEAPKLRIGDSAGKSNEHTVTAGSNSVVLTTTSSVTATENIIFFNTLATSFSVSSVSVTRLGLLLAPDAAQAGGGLVWYDTSGNAANITLPASGVSWNVPTSAKVATGWSFGGDVGIGTTSPEGRLHLAASASGATGSILVLDNPIASALNNSNQIAFLNDVGASYAGIANVRLKSLTTNAGNGSSAFTITTFDGSSEAERVRVFANGNFGIGTGSTDGGQKLQVSGSAAITSNLSLSGTTSTITLGSTNTGSIAVDSNGGLTVTGAASGASAKVTHQAAGASSVVLTGRVASGNVPVATLGGTTNGLVITDNANYTNTLGLNTSLQGNLNAGGANNDVDIRLHLLAAGDTSAKYAALWRNASSNKIFHLRADGDLYTAAGATITGAIAIGNTVQTAASVASTHKVTISIGGTTYYLLATNV